MTKKKFIISALLAGVLWSIIGTGVMIVVVQTSGMEEICDK